MTTETITDYETQEVTREVAHCDANGCPATEDETEMATIKRHNESNRHYCKNHAKELFGIEQDVIRIQGDTKPVIEANPIVSMPWDYFEEEEQNGNEELGALATSIFFTVFYPVLFPWFAYDALIGGNESIDAGEWFIIMTFTIAFLIWTFVPAWLLGLI